MTAVANLVAEMRAVFGDDQRRIAHALTVLSFAERLLATERADSLTTRAAAILHDIGIHEAERKHHSAAGNFQELEGPPIARGVMEKLALEPELVEHVCRIVGSHHSANDIDTQEFRIVWDADWLTNIPDDFPGASQEKLAALIGRVFKTATGAALARELFLAQ